MTQTLIVYVAGHGAKAFIILDYKSTAQNNCAIGKNNYLNVQKRKYQENTVLLVRAEIGRDTQVAVLTNFPSLI